MKTIPIIYEDEYIIAVDKPSGLLVIPAPGKAEKTLTDIVNDQLDMRGIEVNAYPCHRLDKETSGVIIYAKGKKTQGLLMELFRQRDVCKSYIAFVHGNVKNNSGAIKTDIYNRNKARSEKALTHYDVIERKKNFTVIEARPVTGRTNQIRIHFKSIGHPLVGESVFAFRKDFKLRFKRTALHSRSIGLVHPVTKKEMIFESALAQDMQAFLKQNQ